MDNYHFREFLDGNILAHTVTFGYFMAEDFMTGKVFAGKILAHYVIFGDFMAVNILAGDFLAYTLKTPFLLQHCCSKTQLTKITHTEIKPYIS